MKPAAGRASAPAIHEVDPFPEAVLP